MEESPPETVNSPNSYQPPTERAGLLANGWAFDLIGKEISDADYAKFLALTGEAGRQKKQPKIVPQAEQPTLL